MDDRRNRLRYGNAGDLERMIKEYPGEDFWVHENADGPAPLMFGLGDEPLEPGEDYDYSHPLEDAGDELGDKLAAALDLQPVSGDTVHMSGRSRPWWRQLWLRLLPGKRCRYCGSRLYRAGPDGQSSRVWWCPEHGPWEQPERPGWAMEVRTTRIRQKRPLWQDRAGR
jgi:hypothetical protein